MNNVNWYVLRCTALTVQWRIKRNDEETATTTVLSKLKQRKPWTLQYTWCWWCAMVIWIHALHIVALLQDCWMSQYPHICILSLSSMLHVLFLMPHASRLTSSCFVLQITYIVEHIYSCSMHTIDTISKDHPKNIWIKRAKINGTEKPFNQSENERKKEIRMKKKIVLRWTNVFGLSYNCL